MPIRPLPLLDFFVAVVMFSIGLRVSGGELLDVWHKRGLFARMLLANCILIPALGFLLVHEFPLNPEARISILLLAAIPGTPIALQFTRQAKTRLAFTAVDERIDPHRSVGWNLRSGMCRVLSQR